MFFGKFRDDALANVDGADMFPQSRKLPHKTERSNQAAASSQNHRPGCADTVCQHARQQTTQWHCAHKRHGIKSHYPPALVIIHNRLEDGVGGRHLYHHGASDQRHDRQAQPKPGGQAQDNQAAPKQRRRPGNHPAKSTYTLPAGQS